MSNNNPGCLGFILQAIGVLPKKIEEEVLPYAKRDDFLSPAELSFYKVLKQAISGRVTICPKVSLREIFFVKTHDRSDFTTFNNKINLKHVDFLLCSNDTLSPICGIELDDTSHSRTDRIERDKFIEKVFATAGVNLIRFPNRKSYTITEIIERLNPILGTNKEGIGMADTKNENIIDYQGVREIPNEKTDNIPFCKKCGIPMVLREAKKGDNVGDKFWGCVNFPKCRETLKFKEE